MKTILLALVALHCVRAFAAETPALPTKHTTRNLEGWSVRVDDRLIAGRPHG